MLNEPSRFKGAGSCRSNTPESVSVNAFAASLPVVIDVRRRATSKLIQTLSFAGLEYGKIGQGLITGRMTRSNSRARLAWKSLGSCSIVVLIEMPVDGRAQ